MKRKFQRGQATIELCAMLIALAAMILGIVVLSGFFMNNLKILLEARHEAQKQATQKNLIENTTHSIEIEKWVYSKTFKLKDYNDDDKNDDDKNDDDKKDRQTPLLNEFVLRQDKKKMKEGVDIPFALGGRDENGKLTVYPIYYSQNSIRFTSDELNSPNSSIYPEDWQWEKYVAWRKNKDFDSGFANDFTDALGTQNAYDVADLTQGKSTKIKDSAALRVLYSSFERFFWINPRKLDLISNPGNLVYMPRYGSEQ